MRSIGAPARPSDRAEVAGTDRGSAGASRTVQGYIDEVPAWQDGTPVPTAPITAMQWRIWWLATAGKFFEGFVVFMTGVALPLIAAAFAKIGAASTAFLFPMLLADIGTTIVLYILAGTSILGAAIIWLFRIETKGLNLERLGTPDG